MKGAQEHAPFIEITPTVEGRYGFEYPDEVPRLVFHLFYTREERETSAQRPLETQCCRHLVVNDVGGNLPGSLMVLTVVEVELSVDVQGRGGAARGKDRSLVGECVSEGVGIGEGPNPCGPERGLLVDEPGKPIVRLLSCPDHVFQLRKAGVIGIVHSHLETLGVVEIDVDVAVLTILGDWDARPD